MSWKRFKGGIQDRWKRLKKWCRLQLRIFAIFWLLACIFFPPEGGRCDVSHPYRSYAEGELDLAVDDIDTDFNWPVERFRITSKFGWREHPIEHKRDYHEGLDLANNYGTEIHASAGGIVIFSGWRGDIMGETIIINHGAGFKSYYCHLQEGGKIEAGVKVRRGQVIGKMGDSGRTTGSHLHFAIYHNGKAINPFSLLPPFRRRST